MNVGSGLHNLQIDPIFQSSLKCCHCQPDFIPPLLSTCPVCLLPLGDALGQTAAAEYDLAISALGAVTW